MKPNRSFPQKAERTPGIPLTSEEPRHKRNGGKRPPLGNQSTDHLPPLKLGTHAHGKVKWFDASRGFGFIAPMGGRNRDVFVGQRGLEGSGISELKSGQEVNFDVGTNDKGAYAKNVELVESSNNAEAA